MRLSVSSLGFGRSFALGFESCFKSSFKLSLDLSFQPSFLASQLSLAILSGLVFPIAVSARPIPSPIPKATAPVRQTYVQQQRQKLDPTNFDLQTYPLIDRNLQHWRELLWTIAIFEPETHLVKSTLEEILSLALIPAPTPAQQSIVLSAMQVSHQLYVHRPQFYGSLREQFQAIANHSPNPQWTSMAMDSLRQGGADLDEIQAMRRSIPRRFPLWSRDAFLLATLAQIDHDTDQAPPPPLQDLLDWQIAPQQSQLYVFCPSGRRQLCFSLLKDRSGQFVRENGQIWSVPLLLESIHSLSWQFYNGTTPQGIYRMEGTVPQPDTDEFRAYGQFPLIKLFIPFEEGVKAFLPDRSGQFTGDLSSYQQLLPPAWRNYFPIQQTYWAGKIGRSYFRIHGSGEDPNYFQRPHLDRGQWNPTLGCLSALEVYDDQGRLVRGDMVEILQALEEYGNPDLTGYVVVVDVSIELTAIKDMIKLQSPE